MSSDTITLYHAAGSPNSRRVRIFLAEKAIDVALVPADLGQGEQGPIDTDLNPAAGDWATPQTANTALKRYGHVEDIAAMVAFVPGPEAAYITGTNLTVDGGTNA